MSPTAAFLRLELAEALRSRWVFFTSLVYGGLAVAFVWLGLRESTVLVVGLGAIGRLTATMLTRLGCRVIGVHRREVEADVERIVPVSEFAAAASVAGRRLGGAAGRY